MEPYRWQVEFLHSQAKRALILASRQSGKTQVVAALSLHRALTEPRSLVLILSPTLRQSGELFREKLLPLWRAAGSPLRTSAPTQLELRLSNGSRIASLPDSEAGIRGISGVTLLVIDEAARVADDLYKAVRPMLITRDGSLVAMSTPWGQRGWFYEAYVGPNNWHRIKVTAAQCQHYSPERLEEERLELGPLWYAQEYECVFGSLTGALWEADYFPDSIYFQDHPEGLAWASQVPKGILSVDTSHGRQNGDAQAFVHCRYTRDGHAYADPEAYRLDDERLYDKAVELIERWSPSYVVVETNESGYVLCNRLKRLRIGGAPVNVLGRQHHSSEAKQVRIRVRLTPYLSRGMLHVRRSPGGRALVMEAQAFPLKGYHDDLLDALESNLELAYELSLPPGRRNIKYS